MPIVWKVTNAQLRDCYDPTIRYEVGEEVVAQDDGGLSVFEDCVGAMRPIFVDAWPLRLVRGEVKAGDVVSQQDGELRCRRFRVLSEEPFSLVFGSQGSGVVDLLQRVPEADWFKHVGEEVGRAEASPYLEQTLTAFKLEGTRIRWIDKVEFAQILNFAAEQPSPMWETVAEIHDRIEAAAKASSRTPAVSAATDSSAELVMSGSYEGATQAFAHLGEGYVRTASGALMYLLSMATAYEVVQDQGVWGGGHPFRSLLEIFHLGHWPLGVFGNEFLVL